MNVSAHAPATEHPRPRLAVSVCLLDVPAGCDGGHGRDRFLTGPLARHVDRVPVGPEMGIGSGMDGYVVESGLPGRRPPGAFAASIRGALPGLVMEEDGRLRDPDVREHFVERLFAQARVREFFGADWRPRDLVDFHSRNKLQILAHDPAGYRETGRIVAESGARARAALETGYRRAFARALAIRPRRGRDVNALLHVLGPLSDRLDRARRHDIVEAIEAFRVGEAPLGVPIALLRRHAVGEELEYLARQTYLDPFPADLVPRLRLRPDRLSGL
ncbi:hypothetical protein GCM10010191_86240 [Actinomadura vinacea]|uniref:DUF1722 domain-containing protein n=1 Tax=Actinomadura vinacea TaxID=115336 RepID=A0ABN3KBK9_9ACTN